MKNIQTTLEGHKNPLVLISRMIGTDRIQRGMGFVYKNLPGRHKVVATCKHHFMEHPFSDFTFLLGKKLIPLQPVKIFDPGKDLDLVFILVEDRTKTRNMELSRKGDLATKKKGTLLFNCKNNYEPFDFFGESFYVMSQRFFHSDLYMSLSSISSTTGDLIRPSDLRHSEKAIIYPTVGMRTMEGCSGSPIFDEKMNLYGLNLRGVGPQSDIMGYLPTNELEKHYLALKKEIYAAKP